jgi:hypothetical protein
MVVVLSATLILCRPTTATPIKPLGILLLIKVCLFFVRQWTIVMEDQDF